MKKILYMMIAMVFALTFGTAYAGEKLYNGVTDFTGGSYDNFQIGPVEAMTGSVEGISAGGLRAEESKLYNGVTDFTGGSYDNFQIGPVEAMTGSVKGTSAGGLRAEEPMVDLHNGVTDFTGKSYDTFEIGS